ncbi:MAG: adenosylcobinamide-GDP ribazoletransferase [Methanosphaera sp.]|nr:adenosylcobinamide-GDP ribazoletransferase [Methanosphaera sp.]
MGKQKQTVRRHARIKPSVDGVLGLISFSTRIPINRYITIEQMAGSVILWPYIGLGLGLIVGVIAYILDYIILEPLLVATLVYCFIIWFTGFNHTDGVMDLGDGIMVHGDASKRLSVMRDSTVGTGGIATFFIVSIVTIMALGAIPSGYLIQSVILMELCTKLSMITSMVFGDSDTKGIGVEIRKGMDLKALVVSIIVSLVIGGLLLGEAGVIAVFVSALTGLYLSNLADKTFGCVTGDILGASNEIARAVCLVFIVINLTVVMI